MIMQVALIGLVLLSKPVGDDPAAYDWRVISSHRDQARCERARQLFEGTDDFRDLQCIALRRHVP